MNALDPLLAIGLGLAGAGHCLGMCGGIAIALGMGAEGKSTRILYSYHVGRILSYTMVGATLGFALGFGIDVQPGLLIVLRYTAGLLLIAMGLYISGWWHGLAHLEQLGAGIWRPIQNVARRCMPAKSPAQGLALGLCWGAMPCGLIYSSVIWAASHGSGFTAGLLMLMFGMGTLPAMLGISFLSTQLQSLFKSRGWRLGTALTLIAAGLWTLQQAGIGIQGHAHHMM